MPMAFGRLRTTTRAAGRQLALAILLVCLCNSIAFATPSIRVTGAAVTGDGGRTMFMLDLTAGVPAEIFTLADPYRVVIELPAVSFDLPAGAGEVKAAGSSGLVSAFRFGAFADGRSRVVLDAVSPVAVSDAALVRAGQGVRLQFALSVVSEEVFGSGTGAGRSAKSTGKAATEPAAVIDAATASAPSIPPSKRAKPLIMIDAGHGGVDPGAIGGVNQTMEKSVVLAVAWQLKNALEATGRYETRMTRTTDVFIALDKRVQMSEDARPDLFLSLHADAIEDVSAQSAVGASIYTLSDKASDEQARKMAEKENAADLVAGIGQRQQAAPDEVRGILSELWARENSAFSHLFQRSLSGTLAQMKALARTPERSAAFRVLRQSHAPAVLIELGFLSNPREETKLADARWQKQIARAIAAAVDTYFERRKTTVSVAPGLPASGGLPP